MKSNSHFSKLRNRQRVLLKCKIFSKRNDFSSFLNIIEAQFVQGWVLLTFYPELRKT